MAVCTSVARSSRWNRDDRLSPAATTIVSLCSMSRYHTVRELRFTNHSNKHVVNQRTLYVAYTAASTRHGRIRRINKRVSPIESLQLIIYYL